MELRLRNADNTQAFYINTRKVIYQVDNTSQAMYTMGQVINDLEDKLAAVKELLTTDDLARLDT